VISLQPIFLKGQREYAMFVDLKRRYHWVMEPYQYKSKETADSTQRTSECSCRSEGQGASTEEEVKLRVPTLVIGTMPFPIDATPYEQRRASIAQQRNLVACRRKFTAWQREQQQEPH
jgi:hypothetical protein